MRSGQINNNKHNIDWISKGYFIYIITAIMFVVFAFISNGFFTSSNIIVILRQMTPLTILGLGITFVITTGEIDMSIGALPALCGVIVALCLKNNYPVVPSILLALAVAVGIGFINGVITANTNLPGIIVTLGTSMIASGFAYMYSDQRPVVFNNKVFPNIFSGTIGPIPIMLIWLAGLVVLSYVLLHKYKIGRYFAFLGENKTAAYFAGIKIKKISIYSFILCAVFSCMAAFISVAQNGNATSDMLSANMLTAIAATVIGGTSLSGGKGNVIGTVVGAFFLAMLSSGFLILGISQWILYMINGSVIIAALSWEQLATSSKKNAIGI